MIEAANLTKIFKDRKRGQVRAVDSVSFRCKPAEVYGLLGPNGAGKTTTLRLLSTALRPDSGSAVINGVDVSKDPQQVRSQIGFLSGNTGLYSRLSPKEMVTYFGRLYGMAPARIKERMEKIFTMLDMHAFADGRCEKLSTGMKQKVSIARSVIHDPPAMIFDEPTTGLDVISSRTIVEFIKQCRNEGKTVIFSTHIMSEAMRLCDKIGIIHKGKMYSEGTVDEMLAQTDTDNLESAFIKIVGE
ncbi:MAG: ATP-binding cassette domain-containing protein [candidate division Zixibacteria bacterium]|nr:ATP-binding cassette domain-containing protein [candidate division Zixibacteria bacterium]MDH3937671.1 ATP-binding cassette domain-containing protein [candidate division Zixibacteria bacterium]MDH4033123.1 ATP-binding cassette domain-containing protein [candidate division Zixibacteria bacterium]